MVVVLVTVLMAFLCLELLWSLPDRLASCGTAFFTVGAAEGETVMGCECRLGARLIKGAAPS